MSFTVTLSRSQRRFTVRDGESLLDGAERAGLTMPWRCRRGDCGSCAATVLDGTCAPLGADNPLAIRGREVRLCSVRATSDLILAERTVPDVDDIPCRRLRLEVIAMRKLAPLVMDVALGVIDGAPFAWLPGQYLELFMADGQRRAFSIANAPSADHVVHLHIRRVAGGDFTRRVFEELRVGDVLDGNGPLGTFVPREGSDWPMIFVAGGTGYAPVRAIVQHFLALAATRPMHVYWGARNRDELYLEDEIRRWAATAPWLHFHGVLSDGPAVGDLRHGMVHEAVVADFPWLGDFDLYLCGPPPMIDAGCRAFLAAGASEQHLYFDTYDYAPDVLASILGDRAGITPR